MEGFEKRRFTRLVAANERRDLIERDPAAIVNIPKILNPKTYCLHFYPVSRLILERRKAVFHGPRVSRADERAQHSQSSTST
jgi:hypothetical protein